LVDQLEIGLMEERGRVQSFVSVPAAPLPGSETVELVINQGKQLVEGLPVSSPELVEEVTNALLGKRHSMWSGGLLTYVIAAGSGRLEHGY
jgi:hypothetical protein